jgi:hypothetical protein
MSRFPCSPRLAVLALLAVSLALAGSLWAIQSGRPGHILDGALVRGVEDIEAREGRDTLDTRDMPSTIFANVFLSRNRNHFLTQKGTDTQESACAYYRAIGAITERCSNLETFGDGVYFDPPEGLPVGIKFDCAPLFDFGFKGDCRDWKEEHGFKTPGQVVHATYFNAGDLGLGRVMHATTFTKNPGTRDAETITAAYVCNFNSLASALEVGTGDTAGEPGFETTVPAACVAFDWSSKRQFTRLYIFKPFARRQGLPILFVLAGSAALDNAGEKWVPGLCSTCHASNSFHESPSEQFPARADGGDIGIQWLPFDLDAFDYAPQLSRNAQEAAFKRLNDLVGSTAPRPAVQELLEGWYPDKQPPQRSTFVPDGWQPDSQFYRQVFKPFCRTCHVVQFPGVADFREGLTGNPAALICEPWTSATATPLARKMPAAAVTFDQFWNNRAAVAVLSRFLNRTTPCPRPTAAEHH